ncbi:DUF1062 domain-containing protein [Sporomusa malonica]|uniref:DUF1062 domain-containing protein n=1 Tax=Sporomusa malonica TaxID=112901 RepID=A0A1W2F1U2_9FIRM|nr:DUF1062 domain-containing protein [Sporomusa malonica]SMD15890.1 hypothetical protein SAMN04488500_13920 [Sporomusa malonica]
MQKITWEVQYLSPPLAVRYCKKCGKKSEYLCSGLFRVNAQRKYLDIWLIYKCSNCDTTWNSTIYSRTNPQSLSPELLEQFHTNDSNLVEQYAMDIELLRRNGAEVGLPNYRITGDEICIDNPTELHIISKYSCQLNVSTILREKLYLSQKAFAQMLSCGQIKSISGLDLKKIKLHNEVVLAIGSNTGIMRKE